MAAYWEIAAHSTYDMFSMYKYLMVNLFSYLVFWSGKFFLIAPFPDHCLLVHLNNKSWYGQVPFSFICSLLPKDLSFISIKYERLDKYCDKNGIRISYCFNLDYYLKLYRATKVHVYQKGHIPTIIQQ